MTFKVINERECPKCGSRDIDEKVDEEDFNYYSIYGTYKTTLTCNKCGHSAIFYPPTGFELDDNDL